MERLKLSQIAGALGVPCPREGEVSSLCTDSREVAPGCLFAAIRGERFDGHDFIPEALEKGAVCALAEREGPYPRDRVLLVEDTLRALLDLSAWYRSLFPVKVVGITGSVGKTTTKEMTAAVLSARYRTVKTQGNQNNEIGAPRTLLSIGRDTQAAVVEMGMTGFGQIRDLAMAARPQAGIITGIGVSHIELLGSRENILRAKLELADCLPDGAPLFLCGDNDLLREVKIPRLSIIFFGLDDPRSGIYGTIESATPLSTSFTIRWEGKEYRASVPGAGKHLVLDALGAFGAGVALGVPPEEAAAALRSYAPAGMRQRVVERGGITVVEDCYNASPDSVSAALDTLRDFPAAGRKVFVLSDMLELGPIGPRCHREAGEKAASCAGSLFALGELSREAVEGARAAGMEDARFFGGKEELAEALAGYLRPGDLVWFKASRGMKLEEAIEDLYRRL